MNDPGDFPRRHELITAAKLPADAKLDRESAELRETWLAFGKLLDAARADLAGARRAVPAAPLAASRRPRLAAAAAVAALAATLLIALAAWQFLGRARPAAPQHSSEVAAQATDASHSGAVNSGSRVAVTSPHSTAGTAIFAKPPSAIADRLWSDPLDQQLDRAGRVVVQVQNDSLPLADRLGLIQYKFENIRHDIEDEGAF